jgi:hypothetical protein
MAGRHMGSGGIAPPFLTSGLDKGKMSAVKNREISSLPGI